MGSYVLGTINVLFYLTFIVAIISQIFASIKGKNKQVPKKRIEPTLKRENLNELSDLEMQTLLRLANMKWPDNDHIDDWVLDNHASFEGKFNYILALLGALVRAELVKRDMDKIC